MLVSNELDGSTGNDDEDNEKDDDDDDEGAAVAEEADEDAAAFSFSPASSCNVKLSSFVAACCL